MTKNHRLAKQAWDEQSAQEAGQALPTAHYSSSIYPYNCVCFITDSLGQGSGVIIGPHTILTASHLLWDADTGESAYDIKVYPGYSKGGSKITGQWIAHFNQVNDKGGKLSELQSQQDFAVIDFARDLSSYGSFAVQTNYPGGTVHLTGYPASEGGVQTDQVGSVHVKIGYSVLGYDTVTPSPGNSGGPVWIDLGTAAHPAPNVVGVVSTLGWAVQLTPNDWQRILTWESRDAGKLLWSTDGPDHLVGGAGHDAIHGLGGDDRLMGGGGKDVLDGGPGLDVLGGGSGNDTLTGGPDADVFRFRAKLGADNVDTIVDFTVGEDIIDLDKAVFTRLKETGMLASKFFHVGGNADDGNDHILYNPTTGALSYDVDGHGGHAAVRFAFIGAHLSLTNADFLVV